MKTAIKAGEITYRAKLKTFTTIFIGMTTDRLVTTFSTQQGLHQPGCLAIVLHQRYFQRLVRHQ